MKLIKYMCVDCSVESDFNFYTHTHFDYEEPFCPNCSQDKYVVNEGEVDAKEL
jgi:Zn finger protein HypA/HybF involved in hydrogenase expression